MKRLQELEGMHLVTAYLYVMDGRESKTESAKRLGVDLSRLGQYRRGDRPIPDHVQQKMRLAVLLYLLPERDAVLLSWVMSPPVFYSQLTPQDVLNMI